eukprot:TRINITY_DN46060_c0_g1_i1.p1 TRINITY_DN46060_c0_g1~~TRINITY_DN46060_c0_g1_i1.p1  ORF type:complete len:271 (-),score=19.92 TRINITY_DN46060_c0_g1_i1:237-1049(-)
MDVRTSERKRTPLYGVAEDMAVRPEDGEERGSMDSNQSMTMIPEEPKKVRTRASYATPATTASASFVTDRNISRNSTLKLSWRGSGTRMSVLKFATADSINSSTLSVDSLPEGIAFDKDDSGAEQEMDEERATFCEFMQAAIPEWAESGHAAEGIRLSGDVLQVVLDSLIHEMVQPFRGGIRPRSEVDDDTCCGSTNENESSDLVSQDTFSSERSAAGCCSSRASLLRQMHKIRGIYASLRTRNVAVQKAQQRCCRARLRHLALQARCAQ